MVSLLVILFGRIQIECIARDLWACYAPRRLYYKVQLQRCNRPIKRKLYSSPHFQTAERHERVKNALSNGVTCQRLIAIHLGILVDPATDVRVATLASESS